MLETLDAMEFVRIGWDGLGSLAGSLRYSISEWMRYDDAKLASVLSKYEGQVIKNTRIWDLLGEQKNRREEFEITLNTKDEIREFTKMCKKHGIDVLCMPKPNDYKEIIDRANNDFSTLTARERRFVENYCKVQTIDDRIVVELKSQDVVKFTMDAADIKKVERICDEMERKANIRLKKKGKLDINAIKDEAAQRYLQQLQATQDEQMEQTIEQNMTQEAEEVMQDDQVNQESDQIEKDEVDQKIDQQVNQEDIQANKDVLQENDQQVVQEITQTTKDVLQEHDQKDNQKIQQNQKVDVLDSKKDQDADKKGKDQNNQNIKQSVEQKPKQAVKQKVKKVSKGLEK